MRATPGNRARLTILGGFLGSGKTTWLRHQLFHGAYDKTHVVVNEAAATPVDDALLGRAASLKVLAGGCVCCEQRAALAGHLRLMCDRRMAGADSFARIVLETSGLADPEAIVDAIRSDPVLVHHIWVDRVLVTVDAQYALRRLQRDVLIRRQIVSADELILTKMGGVDDATRKILLATLHKLNPGAAISAAEQGQTIALPPHDPAAALGLSGLDGEVDRRPVVAADIDLGPGFDWPLFSVWLSALLHARGDDILRIKGVVATPAGRLLLQCVQRSVLQPELMPAAQGSPDDAAGRLAFIGRGFTRDQLVRSMESFCQ